MSMKNSNDTIWNFLNVENFILSQYIGTVALCCLQVQCYVIA